MAESIPVTAKGQLLYTIELTEGFEALPAIMTELGYGGKQKLCIVTDSNVAALYAGEVQRTLAACFQTVLIHSFPAGEAHKNLETVQHLYEKLILNHFDRGDVLVALGGGVVGDLTGFAAATYLRGIDFIQVPTTLLSQVDSSIGGKTGVDFLRYKNMIGAFYQPKLVYMNLRVLHSLPSEQIVSGMGEIIKHGLIKDISYYQWLRRNREEILRLDAAAVEEMISVSCRIKREVVERDPNEQGERALLNFGHTVGHAIEKLSDFSMYHGECVGIGMIAAAYISAQLKNIRPQELADVEECLREFGLATSVSGFSPEEVLRATRSDKKMAGGKVKFILLSAPGSAYIWKELTDEQILEGIRYVLR